MAYSLGGPDKCGEASVCTALSSVDLRGALHAPALSPKKNPGRRIIFTPGLGLAGFVATGGKKDHKQTTNRSQEIVDHGSSSHSVGSRVAVGPEKLPLSLGTWGPELEICPGCRAEHPIVCTPTSLS